MTYNGTQEFIIPWPPSVNKIYRKNFRVGQNTGRIRITKAGKIIPIKHSDRKITKEGFLYKKSVAEQIYFESLGKTYGKSMVVLSVFAFAPDNRKRDLDNCYKVVCDALQNSKIIENDCQIIPGGIKKGANKKPGYWILQIKPYIFEDEDGTIERLEDKLDALNTRR